MTRKSFKTYAPTEEHSFDINDEVFRINADVPGYLIVDFMAEADEENASAMASLLTNFFNAAIMEEDHEKWNAFVRDPANHVGLDDLSEIAGYIVGILTAGNDQSPLPTPSLPG